MAEPSRRNRTGWAAAAGPARRRRLVLLGFVGVLGAVLVVASRPLPPGDALPGVPDEVVGLWRTADPRFADRELTIGDADVALGQGQGVPLSRGTITGVRGWNEGDASVVRIEYETDDGAQLLELILLGPDRLRLRNPPDVVWSR